MTENFWAARWREGRIGFHEGQPNSFLQRYIDLLGRSRRVLVPLCGKAEDLAYLAAKGHEVVGVEQVRDAVEAFFKEHGLTPRVSKRGAFEHFTEGPLTLMVGDFFALTTEDTGPLNALYDRAAIIALPPELRGPYVHRVRTLLPKSSPGLIVTLEYPPGTQPGPPFSVPEAELRAHYEGSELELIQTQPWTAKGNAGGSGHERCFSFQR